MKTDSPPEYSEYEQGNLAEETPLLQQPMPHPIPHISGPQTTQLVTLTSTNLPVPVRLMDGMMHLTVLEPCRIYCPSCQQIQSTVIIEEASCCAYMSCVALSCFAPLLCWVPFCLKDCKNTFHECGNCGTKLAQVSPA